MKLLNPRFFTSSSSSALFSLSLNPFKFPPLSSQFSRKLQNRQLRFSHYRDTLCFSRSASARATMCASQPSIHVKDRIDLTAKENEIFDRLLQVLSHFSLQTQLRVAGGWVRDKVSQSLYFSCFSVFVFLQVTVARLQRFTVLCWWIWWRKIDIIIMH